MPRIVFLRRQSPDWRSLAADFRRGATIDPARFVPARRLTGFPDGLAHLVERWNTLFAIDFFSFRALLADLSRRSAEAVAGARLLTDEELGEAPAIAAGGNVRFYFHDDDDFFAPEMADRIGGLESEADAIVTPMFKLTHSVFTMARPDIEPSVVWGERKAQQYRYHTNNYGLHPRRCGELAELEQLKDHVEASRRADEAGFTDVLLPDVLSATVKSPASAGMLRPLFAAPHAWRPIFAAFAEKAADPGLPPGCAWLEAPVKRIGALVEAMLAEAPPETYEKLIAAS